MLIGHKKQFHNLMYDLSSGNLAHAYIICGASQIAKFTLAKEFSRKIQAMSEDQILESNVDISVFDDDGESLKIEEVRKICNKALLSSAGKYKIVLIKNIDRLTLDASNAFLKTLEEPNPKVIFIMTASDLSKVLETIKSRARIVYCNALSHLDMKEFAKKYDKTDQALLEKFIALASGRPGKLHKILNDEQYQALLVDIDNEIRFFIETKNIVRFWLYIEQIASEKQNCLEFLNIWELITSKIIFEKIHLSKFPFLISEARDRIYGNCNQRLVLENLSLKFRNLCLV